MNDYRKTLLVFSVLTALLAASTYLFQFHKPSQVVWDESVYIADAERYLQGIFFMETHPPLGKLLVAAGEGILDFNKSGVPILGNKKMGDMQTPEGLSFAGYRFFPVLLSWLNCLVLFWIFILITRKPLWAFFLSFLIIFDNALVVQGRHALLEGPQLLFVLTSIALYLTAIGSSSSNFLKKNETLLFGLLGFTAGCAFMTKINGLIVTLLVPALLVYQYVSTKKIQWADACEKIGIAFCGFLIAFIGIWQIHFSLISVRDPELNNSGYYSLNESNRELLDIGHLSLFSGFPSIFSDIWTQQSGVHLGWEPLDLCSDDEKGSPVWSWPFGGRSINYRWSKLEGNLHAHITMQSNPVVWLSGLLAVLLGIGLLVYSKVKNIDIHHRFVLGTLLVLYILYMGVLASVDRALYLQAYLIPLCISFVIFGILISNIDCVFGKIQEATITCSLTVFALAIFLTFSWYRPLTYYLPVTATQIEKRAIIPYWDLRCHNCPRTHIPEYCTTEN